MQDYDFSNEKKKKIVPNEAPKFNYQPKKRKFCETLSRFLKDMMKKYAFCTFLIALTSTKQNEDDPPSETDTSNIMQSNRASLREFYSKIY